MAKSKYQSDFPQRAEKYASEGLSDVQIAAKLGISHETYYKYQQKYAEFLDAIKRGKAPVDDEVENALLKSALGYECEEIIQEIKIVDGKEHKTVKKVKRQIAPVPSCIFFWLVNRRPERWRSINKDHDDRSQNYTGNFQFHVIEAADDNGES